MAAVAGLYLVALLRLAGSPDRTELLPSLVEGALAGACLYFVSWELAIQPAHHDLFAGHPVTARLIGECALLAVPFTAVLLVVGAGAVVVVRGVGRRAVLLRLGGVATGTTVLGVLVVAAARYAAPGLVALAVAGYAAALLGTGLLAPRLTRLPRLPWDLARPQVLVSLVPMLVAIAATVVRRLAFGPLDKVGFCVLVVAAILVSLRQSTTVLRLRQVLVGYRHQAHTDPLTGLPNRRELLAVLAGVTGPATVILVDLDGFKAINDARGHDAGDQVLIEVAARMRAVVPADGFVARLGGDEFAVLVGCPPERAAAVAERLRAALAEPVRLGDSLTYLSASLGLSGIQAPDAEPADPGAEGPDRLLANADVALRFAKQRGKNRVENYVVADALWLRRRNRLEQELRGAAGRGELSLVFQPVMELPAGRTVGAEALLRWTHPQLGAVPPDEFIPIAEDAGLVSELDRWVLDQACGQLARWLAAGYELWTAVNISVRDLHQPGYVDRVLGLLRRYDLPPSLLVLEVTEHAVALDPDEVAQRLSELRALGVRVALDDFGAGYSSLGQLLTLPVDIVKIDRALLAEPLLDISVQLGQRLGKLVIAEGIADEESRAAVQRTPCPLGQGSALCPPVPADRVTALLVPVRPATDTGTDPARPKGGTG